MKEQRTIPQLLNDPMTCRTYRYMIANSEESVVKELRQVLKDKAPNHPRRKDLEVAFIARLGK